MSDPASTAGTRRRGSGSILLAALFLAAVVSNTSCRTGEMTWAGVKEDVRDKYPTVVQLATPELASWLQSDSTSPPILLDVRQADEYQTSHLKGALLATDLEDALKHLDDKSPGRPIVLYCSVGYRSSELAGKLQKKGFTRVYNLEGSLFQWANEGRPVFRGEEQVHEVHPFDRRWGVLLKTEYWPRSYE